MEQLKPRIFKDRLTTTDEFGHRVRIIPMVVRGYFQRYKFFVHLFLVGLFLILPWIQVNGGPLVLLDVSHRRFFLFGHMFLPQDAPGIFFVIAFFGMSLILMTALFGRVWCGWACPQTVFIEGFFRRVERFVEGTHIEQRELERAPWRLSKIRKKTCKWGLFLMGSLVVTHSFLAYFVGAENVASMVLRSPSENPGSFAVVMISTAIILFDFGWFREQFCLIACPYGRFQSIMMDPHSINVAYDAKRGEPRKLARDSQHGDCINCLKCVKVCPTGIDIRNGFQMECIACTACIDACDDVMTKIGKPQGLIRYASERELLGEKRMYLRPRIFLYVGILLILAIGLFYRVSNQEIRKSEILRAIDAPYQLLSGSGGSKDFVINHFKFNLYNLTSRNAKVELALSPEDQGRQIEIIQQKAFVEVAERKTEKSQFFIKFPAEVTVSGSEKIKILVKWNDGEQDDVKSHEVTLVGPVR